MGKIWELDFYSRPLLDENQKKIWEVVVCESPTNTRQAADELFRYTKYCPSTQVNSVWLRNALEEAIAQAPNAPVKIRFFRRQMNNMISKACKELGIDPVPSGRTVALNQWLQERMATVYPQHPGFDEAAAKVASPSVRMETGDPQPLPDALRFQKWAFVSLPAGDFAEMPEWDIGFSDGFPLERLGLSADTLIPGLIIFSGRAVPQAGWLSGLELSFISVETQPQARLILQTGVSDRWVLSPLKDQRTQAEALEFQQSKEQANGVHFLAIQSGPNSESFAGFWLMQELHLS